MEGVEEAVPAQGPETTLPEEPTGTKRRASHSPEAEEDPKKRVKVGEAQSPQRDADHSPTHPDRRTSIADDDHHENRRPTVSKEEEKRRGKRLFGGLLNTLSQKTPSTQLKKRREIEQRQQEKAQKQKVEDDKRLAERLARLNKARRHDQIDFDEKVMKLRHANLLARAHSLYTKAEPRIYYKPWKLTAAQEDIIDDQIADAKETAEKEVAQHTRRREERGHHRDRDHGRGHRRGSTPRGERLPRWSPEYESAAPPREPEPAPEAEAEPPAPVEAEAAPAEATNGSSEHSDKAAPPAAAVADKEQPEEQGDVVVDNEEDMVMY